MLAVRARGRIFIADGIILVPFRAQHLKLSRKRVKCRYNVSTNEWQFIASLHAPRKNGSMVCLRSCLFVVGGGLSANGEVSWDALVVESCDFERNS